MLQTKFYLKLIFAPE